MFVGNFFFNLIDTIEIEIPGEKSYAITSAGTVLKEGFFNNQKAKKISDGIKEVESVKEEFEQNNNTEPTALLENKQQTQVIDKMDKNGYAGKLAYKVEWSGYGAKMPPESFDTQVKQLEEKKLIEDEELQVKFKNAMQIFDVNDPRNEKFIQKMIIDKQIKNKQGNIGSIKAPYADNVSFRQKLLKIRFHNTELKKFSVPLLQREIRRSD